MHKLLIFLLIGGATCMPESGLQEKRHEVLHERYTLDWQANFNDKTIDFWVTCQTTGFVGLGLSQSGSMVGSDLVIGGVNDSASNEIYFQDYHGAGLENGPPEIDLEQSWKVMSITQEKKTTVMHLRRELDTCDSEDLPITDGTIKIIWSFGETDNIGYHGHDTRGTLAVNILDPALPPTDLSSYETFNMTRTIEMTGEDTIYWCSLFQRNSTNQSHIVAFKPKLETPEALKYTHHFNVYTCRAEEGDDPDEVFGPFVDHEQNCLLEGGGIASIRHLCYTNLYAWSLGGRLLVFPPEIGVSWGFDETEYYFMEVHLDNKAKVNATVETGLTVYYTENLREIDGGLLSIGHSTSPSLLIPPSTNGWTLAGHCSPDCTKSGIPEEGINMFNLNLHAHMSGRKMRMRQFRNGKELEWVANDETYDFNYQENRPLQNSVKLLPGDQITFECTFDTNWNDPPKAVIGGASSYDEMCMVFVFYYPRAPLESCFSGYPTDKILSRYGITKYHNNIGSRDPIIDEPKIWQGRKFTDILTNEVKWNETILDDLNQELRYGLHQDNCFVGDGVKRRPSSFVPYLSSRGHFDEDDRKGIPMISYPDVDQEYTKPNECPKDAGTTNSANTTPSSDGPDSTEREGTTEGSAVRSLTYIPLLLLTLSVACYF